MSITNGTFDTDLSGWTPSGNGNYDVIWDTGRARLRVYQCSNAYLEQTFIIDINTISFDYETATDNWSELPKWQLIIGGTTIIDENIATGRGTTVFGTKTIDTSAYVGQTAIIRFSIIQSWACANYDHANTYLYIDNVGPGIVATNIVPNHMTCTSPCDITIDVTWENLGTISRSFYPAIVINGVRTPFVLPEVLTQIDPGTPLTKSFLLPGLTGGTYNICPDPK